MRFVHAQMLKPGMQLARDISSRSHAFMLTKGTHLTANYITYLQDKGYLGAYIEDELSKGIIIEEPVAPETFEHGVEAVAQEDVDGIINVSESIVSQIATKKSVCFEMLDLRSFDDYTFHHSVNVAIYAVAVGKVLKLSAKELEQLATSALCHDLGKSKIPPKILNKPGKLTEEEYDIIKTHSKHSYDILYDNDMITSTIRQAVLMHHENENGTGYPLGRQSDEIPLFAKIIHACDVYDALTSRRIYKDPYSHEKAHEYLEEGADTLFDKRVVEALLSAVPVFPCGIDVQLSNGQKAIVYEQTINPRRPRIRLKETLEEIDLSSNPSYKSVEIVSSGYAMILSDHAVEKLNEGRLGEESHHKLIMVVDDSSISLMQTKAAIGNSYEVVSINNGIEAISYIKEKRVPDLIIMDVEMPILNGISAVRTIRENGFTRIPVIFLTASCDRETVMKGKAVGASDYIIKPASPMYLRERVRVALEGEMD